MTRRIIKTTHKGWDCQKMTFALSKSIQEIETKISDLIGFHAFFSDNESPAKIGVKCPYGQPGDVLWVRETWMHNPNIHICPEEPIYFKASKSKQFIEEWPGYWKPSIHMTKATARIWLHVKEIRVERLQDISEDDAIVEGVTCYEADTDWLTAKYGFQILWEKINGEESWKANPWVWVVKFKVLSLTGKPSFITQEDFKKLDTDEQQRILLHLSPPNSYFEKL